MPLAVLEPTTPWTCTPSLRRASTWTAPMKPVPTTAAPTSLSADALTIAESTVVARGADVERGQQHDDRPVEDLLQGVRRVEQREKAAEDGQDQGPDERACITAVAAIDRGPPDDHRGHGRQQVDVSEREIHA